MFRRIANGRTDLILDLLAGGQPATSVDESGVSLIKWCAYYGDVTAIRVLLSKGEVLKSLGANALNEAAFHGHWRLGEFLIENGADVNGALPDTGETPLHAALCTSDRSAHDLVLELLLDRGADPNRATKPGVETGGFMRDGRTRGETPLHRAAAFGTERTIDLLLAAGARVDAKDANGDSPLTWGSWYLRPDAVLRKLCYDGFKIHPERQSMRANLLGKPLPKG
ncbi:MAG TPA: ankyrin repeat domain-containing protein [Thermoanaerobaculia bacterium]|nr:ankyrin repeat domain-containing protein [Thermoanaerobaculia bacterium]